MKTRLLLWSSFFYCSFCVISMVSPMLVCCFHVKQARRQHFLPHTHMKTSQLHVVRRIPSVIRFISASESPEEQQHQTLQDGTLYQAELEVKKSRFIGYAHHVTSWGDAQSVLQEIRSDHPKARHVCVGFRCGYNPVNERSSDDGEPTGTAGSPILGAVRGKSLSDTLCVVVRYFGGTKLGAGGLIRAYGGATRLVLDSAPVQVLIPQTRLQMIVDSVHVGVVYELAGKYQGTASNEEYLEDGTLSMSLTIEAGVEEQVRQDLNDATKGTADVKSE